MKRMYRVWCAAVFFLLGAMMCGCERSNTDLEYIIIIEDSVGHKCNLNLGMSLAEFQNSMEAAHITIEGYKRPDSTVYFNDAYGFSFSAEEGVDPQLNSIQVYTDVISAPLGLRKGDSLKELLEVYGDPEYHRYHVTDGSFTYEFLMGQYRIEFHIDDTGSDSENEEGKIVSWTLLPPELSIPEDFSVVFFGDGGDSYLIKPGMTRSNVIKQLGAGGIIFKEVSKTDILVPEVCSSSSIIYSDGQCYLFFSESGDDAVLDAIQVLSVFQDAPLGVKVGDEIIWMLKRLGEPVKQAERNNEKGYTLYTYMVGEFYLYVYSFDSEGAPGIHVDTWVLSL